jgi:hypothetical protein
MTPIMAGEFPGAFVLWALMTIIDLAGSLPELYASIYVWMHR